MANTVYLSHEECIYCIYEGDQTYLSVKDGMSKTESLVQNLRRGKKQVKILIDLTHLGKTHSSARKIGVESLRTLDFDKVAMFGNSVFTKHLVNFIITASGKQETVQYFNTKEEAQDWLDCEI